MSFAEQPAALRDRPKEMGASGVVASRARPSPQPSWLEVRPSAAWAPLRLQELWAYRHLIYFFAWRDLKVRYKQTLLGAAWVILQPLAMMLVFTLLFGALAKIPSDGLPYAVWAYVGLMAWQYVSFVVTQSAAALVSHQNLLKKVFFPRLTIPLSIALTGLVDLGAAALALAPLMLAYGMVPSWRVLAVAPVLLLASVAALGVGMWTAALNVKYRDVRYVIPFLMQFWMFVSPIVYPSSMVPQTQEVFRLSVPLRALYGLNPMVSVVEGFRWALLDGSAPLGAALWLSAGCALVIFVSGLFYFRRVERHIADIV